MARYIHILYALVISVCCLNHLHSFDDNIFTDLQETTRRIATDSNFFHTTQKLRSGAVSFLDMIENKGEAYRNTLAARGDLYQGTEIAEGFATLYNQTAALFNKAIDRANRAVIYDSKFTLDESMAPREEKKAFIARVLNRVKKEVENIKKSAEQKIDVIITRNTIPRNT
jgi:hypothetical protein